MNKCPYCNGEVTPPDVKKYETPPFAHGQCTECNRSPRAKVSWNKDGKMFVSYSRDGRKTMNTEFRKNPVSFRVSDYELRNEVVLNIKGKLFILKPYTETV